MKSIYLQIVSFQETFKAFCNWISNNIKKNLNEPQIKCELFQTQKHPIQPGWDPFYGSWNLSL